MIVSKELKPLLHQPGQADEIRRVYIDQPAWSPSAPPCDVCQDATGTPDASHRGQLLDRGSCHRLYGCRQPDEKEAFLPLIVIVRHDGQTCAPTQAPVPAPVPAPAPISTAAPILTPAPGTIGRKKRDANHVEVTIVSRQNFDPEMNPSYLKVVEAKVEEYSKHIGLENNREVKGDVRNIGGKFAVVYNLPGADCDKVIDFVKGAKENTDVIEHTAVKCEDRKKVFL
ncbi:unnamed protein product [Heligmosomoides polygyrus]|uniref:Uncharacterized protein n=1 Tax=Heligmosomoides polygyrus TaxID=6339 RepID=A0A183F3E1_HELPZ|nr:unnamed protein product [Heligmosomoides polygyrus]